MGNCNPLIIVSVLTSVSCSFGSQVITRSFGKTATLQCQIANHGSDLRSLYWNKDGATIYSLTSERGNGKYSVTDTMSLVIPDVTESDAGNYSCIAAFRKPYVTIKSDIMQLYVIDVSVSHCKDTGQEVDGCSCNINGSNITSLLCSASGFPHPPDVTWEEGTAIYQSSSIDLTRFRENITLTCKARDGNLKSAVENKTVCVYYAREVTPTGGSPVEVATASVHDRARIAAIVILSLILILVLLKWLKQNFKRKKGRAFQFSTSIMCTSKSKESSVGDLPTSQPVITSIEDEIGDDDFSPKDCDQNGVMGDEQQLSLVGLVLLDDLRSAPEETKESIKAAVVALVVDSCKIHQSHVDPRVTIHSLLINLNETLQRSVNTAGVLGNHDAAFDLDRVLGERDRDECEILITKPDLQEVADESQIQTYQGSSFIHQSLSMPAISSSMVAFNQRPSFLRGELQSSERAAIRNAISRIIQDGLVTGHSRPLRGKSYLNCCTDTLQSSVSNPAVKTWQEEDEIPDNPSTAKLLEDRCRDSEESNNEHYDYVTK